MPGHAERPTIPGVKRGADHRLISSVVISQVEWKYIVIDEAQRMKDRQSKLAKDLDRFTGARRLLLTGTPLQNELSELWSLLNLLLPEVTRRSFLPRFYPAAAQQHAARVQHRHRCHSGPSMLPGDSPGWASGGPLVYSLQDEAPPSQTGVDAG